MGQCMQFNANSKLVQTQSTHRHAVQQQSMEFQMFGSHGCAGINSHMHVILVIQLFFVLKRLF